MQNFCKLSSYDTSLECERRYLGPGAISSAELKFRAARLRSSDSRAPRWHQSVAIRSAMLVPRRVSIMLCMSLVEIDTQKALSSKWKRILSLKLCPRLIWYHPDHHYIRASQELFSRRSVTAELRLAFSKVSGERRISGNLWSVCSWSAACDFTKLKKSTDSPTITLQVLKISHKKLHFDVGKNGLFEGKKSLWFPMTYPTSQPSCVWSWLSKLQALSEGLPFHHQVLCLMLRRLLQIKPCSWDLNHEWLRSGFPSWRKLNKFDNVFIKKSVFGHCLLWNLFFNFKNYSQLDHLRVLHVFSSVRQEKAEQQNNSLISTQLM